MTQRVLVIEGLRTLDVPPIWLRAVEQGKAEIYNAAQPFPAHMYHEGEFCHGIFYGLIFRDRDDAARIRGEAISLDAHLVVRVSREQVLEWARPKYEPMGISVDDFPYEKIAEAYWLYNHGEEVD